jgi:hypothetical protein
MLRADEAREVSKSVDRRPQLPNAARAIERRIVAINELAKLCFDMQ